MSENVWTPIGPAPEYNSGVVGGDGAGQSWSVRFAHRDYPRHTVTVYVYPFDAQERNGGNEDFAGVWDVEEMVVFEEWDRPWNEPDAMVDDAEHETGYAFDIAPRNEATAKAWAKTHAEDWHRNGHRNINWNPENA